MYTGNVVEWLKRRDCDQRGLGSKPTRTIMLCFWRRHHYVVFLEKTLNETFPYLVDLASISKFQSCLDKNNNTN